MNKIYEENFNNQGYLMKIVQYNNAKDIIVEFQDKNKARVHTQYHMFKKGMIRNPFHPIVCGIGYLGNSNSLTFKSFLKHTIYILSLFCGTP